MAKIKIPKNERRTAVVVSSGFRLKNLFAKSKFLLIFEKK